jgi:uncharacterized protein (TIGR02145 family)
MLNNVAEKPAGKAYGNADVMSNVYGRYYSYLEAISVCESLSTSGYEWKLPSLDDWKTLEAYIKEQPKKQVYEVNIVLLSRQLQPQALEAPDAFPSQALPQGILRATITALTYTP